MSSEYKVPLTTILKIEPHNNAERLSVAYVYGFQVIVQKEKYKIGDSVIYVPIDSILPEKLEHFLFPPDSKVKLHKSRIRQIRLRGLASQGMLIDPEEMKALYGIKKLPELESDLASLLDIKKYEPPVPEFQARSTGGSRNKPLTNILFQQYHGLSNVKWFPNLFSNEEQVVLQEKLHGSLIRFSKLPPAIPTIAHLFALLRTLLGGYERMSILKSAIKMASRIVKAKLGTMPAYENCYGSNNVDLTNRVGYVGYYGENVYAKAIERIKGFEKIVEGETVYGELIGNSIQKNYSYGRKEHHIVIFDVKVMQADGTQVWLNPEEVVAFAEKRGFDVVPTLYCGPYNADLAKQLSSGPSVYCPEQKVREGAVIKSRYAYNDINCAANKKALKLINEEYLDDKNNSDFQ